jgi:hypothetical protein
LALPKAAALTLDGFAESIVHERHTVRTGQVARLALHDARLERTAVVRRRGGEPLAQPCVNGG